MKFKLKIGCGKKEWVEDFDRKIGEQKKIRGLPDSPVFTGDVDAWGKAIIEWFNSTRQSGEKKRKYLGIAN